MTPAPGSVAAQVRRARSRARRQRQSLGDALYVVYVTVLVAFFPLYALFAGPPPAPGPARAAAAAAEPLLVLAVATAVVSGRCAAAVRGGPVVLPPEDARLLLTWPLPRRAVVLPALLAALSRAVAAAVLVSLVLVYVDVRTLGAPARAVLRDDLLLPALLSVVVALLAWLVQVSPRLAPLVRLAGAALALAGLVALCVLGRRLAVDGPLPSLRSVAPHGSGGLPLSGAATGRAAPAGLLAAALLAVLLVPLGLLSVRATSRATPERLLGRSRRADVTRTALRLGFTASVYLTRTEPLRRARRRRLSPPGGTPTRALVAKAVLQEQGTPVLPRLLAAAAAVGAVVGAAAHVRPGRDAGPTLIWALAAAVALTVVATRFADPVRLDVDRAPLSGSLPVPHRQLAQVDLLVSAGLALLGAVLGVVVDALLGVVEPGHLPRLLPAAAALALLLAAAGALGALSDDPSPLLPPWAAVGYRTTGFAAVLVACVGSALVLRLPGAPGSPPDPDRLPTAVLVTAVVALVTAAIARHRAAGALTRGR